MLATAATVAPTRVCVDTAASAFRTRKGTVQHRSADRVEEYPRTRHIYSPVHSGIEHSRPVDGCDFRYYVLLLGSFQLLSSSLEVGWQQAGSELADLPLLLLLPPPPSPPRVCHLLSRTQTHVDSHASANTYKHSEKTQKAGKQALASV